ncbi:MAG: DUF4255 domain-containing protein [Acidimicrobiia bacterium]|nr:DUF4255 domain-containing protein [Acidimicrobiia bacterium]
MLHRLDEAVELFLRQTVPLDARDIDVSFDAPDRTWAATLTRPTVNVFLWDIRRSTVRAQAGVETAQVDGRTVRRRAATRVDLRYLVTAWTTERRDEHQLIGSALRAVLSNPELPADLLTGELAGCQPPRVELSPPDARTQADLWSAMDGQLKPGLDLCIVLPIETTGTLAGPPLDRLDLSVVDRREPGRESRVRLVAGRTDPAAVGAVVQSPHGTALVSGAGHFLVRAEPGDAIVVDTEPPRSAVVPAQGGVVI